MWLDSKCCECLMGWVEKGDSVSGYLTWISVRKIAQSHHIDEGKRNALAPTTATWTGNNKRAETKTKTKNIEKNQQAKMYGWTKSIQIKLIRVSAETMVFIPTFSIEQNFVENSLI